ncbi:MAG: hypothetical protein KAJ42_14460, partial [Gemmatimonadetes bacterium]|nr:hypothetical protein [Gemmatimonadota bacterium]
CVTIVEWQGDALWNRIVLESSLGFESAAPYEVPDVVMSTEAVVQVTLELRLHVDPSENEQEIDIAGETTTVTTRVNDLDNAARWGGTGLLGNLGGWRDDTRAARIGESNTLPGSVNDPMPDAGSELAESAEKLEGGWENRRYHFGPAKGNFPTGTGYLIHGNFSTDTTELSCFVTVFDPKISKTDEDRLEFDIDYSWSRT